VSPAGSARLLADAARRARGGKGAVLDGARVRQAPDLRTALAGVPATTVRTVDRGGVWGLTTSAGCPLLVAVDRRLALWDQVAELAPASVAAVEVYARLADVPPEFVGLLARAHGLAIPGCGLALLWTGNAR
jgi:hypothetical protein